MIKFFRHIRKTLLGEGSTKKYFFYAIGEIVLVVIGILIALSINNWNETRNSQHRISNYSLNLIEDLKQDIKENEQRIKQIKRRISYVKKTADFVRNKKISELTNLELIYEFNLVYGYKPFTWYSATIEEIKNSGSLKLIKNDSLRNKIISYYALTRHLDEDYKTDNNIADKLELFQSRIINTNYPNREEFLDTMRFYYKKPREEWMATETFKKANKLNLQILTNDINDIHELVNYLFTYKSGLRTRANNELPKLIKLAKQIIAGIEKEYHD